MTQNLEQRTEQMLVVGRDVSRRELVFHYEENFFFAVTRPRDETKTAYIIPVTEETYLEHHVGDTIEVPQYSVNGSNWYFSKNDAQRYTPSTQ